MHDEDRSRAATKPALLFDPIHAFPKESLPCQAPLEPKPMHEFLQLLISAFDKLSLASRLGTCDFDKL